MKFYKYLYIGESVKDPEKVKWKLKVNAGQLAFYVITLAEGSDQLEYYHAAFLKQKKLRRLSPPPYIIGIANGQAEAQEIVTKIVGECYAQTGTANLKEFLLKRG
jgi:hypothetical protein